MSSAAQLRRVGPACDRCYELKERCERALTTIACARCDRVGQRCLTIRPVRPAGRRPHHSQKTASKASPSQQSTVVQRSLDRRNSTRFWDIPDLRPEEKELLMFFLSQPNTFEYCVVSPSFNNAEQRSFAAPLPAALPVLKNAYLACAGALKSLHYGNKTEVNSNANLRYASSAMRTLRSLPVDSSRDAVICLTLGISLALFVYSAIGMGVSDICHCCLSRAGPFIDTAVLDPETEPLLSFLVLLETMDCFVHRQKPTIRIQLRKFESVDRHLGLCLPLLPYYYDLCVINHSLASTTDTWVMAHLQKQLDGIQAAVDAWQPLQPGDFIQQFETTEVVHLLAQARVYRLAALLMSHRLRYVFGQEDSQADFWSKEVMRELELAQRITKRVPRCVTLPFIIAAVEIRGSDARMKTLKNVAEYVDQFTPVVQKATRSFLTRLWKERDTGMAFSWINSVHKPCVVLDSIDRTSLFI